MQTETPLSQPVSSGTPWAPLAVLTWNWGSAVQTSLRSHLWCQPGAGYPAWLTRAWVCCNDCVIAAISREVSWHHRASQMAPGDSCTWLELVPPTPRHRNLRWTWFPPSPPPPQIFKSQRNLQLLPLHFQYSLIDMSRTSNQPRRHSVKYFLFTPFPNWNPPNQTGKLSYCFLGQRLNREFGHLTIQDPSLVIWRDDL